jgi:hypothetical protein
MQKGVALPRTDRTQTDPWWNYYGWQNQTSGALLAELYSLILQEGPR